MQVWAVIYDPDAFSEQVRIITPAQKLTCTSTMCNRSTRTASPSSTPTRRRASRSSIVAPMPAVSSPSHMLSDQHPHLRLKGASSAASCPGCCSRTAAYRAPPWPSRPPPPASRTPQVPLSPSHRADPLTARTDRPRAQPAPGVQRVARQRAGGDGVRPGRARAARVPDRRGRHEGRAPQTRGLPRVRPHLQRPGASAHTPAPAR